MAELSFNCEVSQAFNWQKDAQPLVGHLNSLTIGDKDLVTDLKLTDPESVTDRIEVVGAISHIHWNGGYADPITMNVQISTTNKTAVTLLTQMEMAATSTEFEFTIYSYDQDADPKTYFKTFHCDGTALHGLVAKAGSKLDLFIDQEQSGEILSPANYTLDISMMPAEQEAQALHVAVDVSNKFVKEWGVGIG